MNTTAKAITEKIIQVLEKGECPWKKPWSSLAVNISGREYRGFNKVWLSFISASESKSNVWLTFKQAKALGASVKKGAKSELVTLWKPQTKTIVCEDGETIEDKYLLLRGYCVFNADQIDNLPEDKLKDLQIPQKEFKPLKKAEEIVKKYFNKQGITLVHGGDMAYYSKMADLIQLPPKKHFSKRENYYSTIFHEMAHSTGAKSRLDRFKNESFEVSSELRYSREELVAEITAAMLCNYCGISCETIENQAAYCKSWSSFFKESPATVIATAAAQAQKAFDFIIDDNESQD